MRLPHGKSKYDTYGLPPSDSLALCVGAIDLVWEIEVVEVDVTTTGGGVVVVV